MDRAAIPVDAVRGSLLLIVDDVPTNLSVLGQLLRDAGYRVKAATSGPAALRYAVQEPKPALILLDVMMPGVDGLTVSRTLAADPVLGRIPLVMLSALGTPADVQAGLSTGVHAYLVKPFSPWELLDMVERLTSGASTTA